MNTHASQSICLCDWLLTYKYLYIHFTDDKLNYFVGDQGQAILI